MRPEPFLDTNVLIYAFVDNSPRHQIAKSVLAVGGVISAQVANEFVDVARRKLRWEWDDVAGMLRVLRERFGVPAPITDETHRSALDIARRYGFRIYDGLIVAAAREAGCPVLYTEDLQDGQTVDGVLVKNPFLA